MVKLNMPHLLLMQEFGASAPCPISHFVNALESNPYAWLDYKYHRIISLQIAGGEG